MTIAYGLSVLAKFMTWDSLANIQAIGNELGKQSHKSSDSVTLKNA